MGLNFVRLVCVLSSVCLWAPGALAQDEKTRARGLFADGVAAFERGEYPAALESFKEAYRLAPHPAVRVNMANCFEQLGQVSEAIFNYQRFLEEGGAEIAPAQRAEVEHAIARLKQRVGSLILVLDPPDASLSVDAGPARRDPRGSLQLPAGPHTLRVSKPGYQTYEKLVDVEGGVERELAIRLIPDLSEPEAAPLDASPAEAEALSSETAGPQTAEPADGPPPRRLRPAIWAALGTTAVFGIGLIVTGSIAFKAQHTFDDAVERSHDESLDAAARLAARSEGFEAADRADVFASVSDVLLAGTVVAGVTTLTLWFIDRRRAASAERSLTLEPRGSRAGGGLVLKGMF